jgi:RNA exonuclease 1
MSTDALHRVRENMGKLIQVGGGTVGHSSVEDSIATLDLVRWYVLNGAKRKGQQPIAAALPVDHQMD